MFDPKSQGCYFDCSYHKTFLYFLNICLSRIAPLIFNIVVYALVTHVIRTRNIFKSKKSCEILIRAVLICSTFTLSWLPGEIVNGMNVKDAEILQISQFIFYINCLTDPLFYTCTSKLFHKCWSKLKARSTSRITTRRTSKTVTAISPKYSEKLHTMKTNTPTPDHSPSLDQRENSLADDPVLEKCVVFESPCCKDGERKHSLLNTKCEGP